MWSNEAHTEPDGKCWIKKAWQVAREIHVENRIKDCGPRTQDRGPGNKDRTEDWGLRIKDSGWKQASDDQELSQRWIVDILS